MASNDSILIAFSAGFVLVAGLMLIVPILKRTTDVFTTWNLFLVGAIIFTGLSGIKCARSPHYSPDYTSSDYSLYYLGTVLFYGVTALTYHYFKVPRRLAGFTMRSWPRLDGAVLVVMVIVLGSLIVFQRVSVPIPVVGQLLFQFGVMAPLLAFTCAFVAWYRDRTNILLLALLLGVGLVTVLGAIGVGGSRRYLISALACPALAYYWIALRYESNAKILRVLGVAAALTLPVVIGYGLIRHSINTKEGGVARAVEVVRALPNAIRRGGSAEGLMGQDSVECALLVIHMLTDGSRRLEVEPLYSVKYIVVNPIPRTLWPNKPVALGAELSRIANIRYTNANYGINVAAQCYYDGGLWVHVLYGVMMGGFMRFFDELLIRQAGNPLLIGALVGMSAQLLGWPRGGIEVIGLQIVLAYVVMWLTTLIMLLVFGVGLRYPRTDHLLKFPSMRSPQDWARWMQSYTAPASTARRYRDDDDEPEDSPNTAGVTGA